MGFLARIFGWDEQCPTCEVLKEQIKLERTRGETHCESCDTLTRQLEIVHAEKNKLLEHIIHPPQPEQREVVMPQPLIPKNKPWAITQHQLETEDREKAAAQRLEAERKREIAASMPTKSTEELEKEMGVNNG